MNTPMLETKGLTVSYGSFTIVENIDLTVNAGDWLMLIGPNGAGKSTILNAISQSAPYKGTVLANGKDASKIKPVHLAQYMGMLAQNHYPGYSFTVEEVVRLGRYAYSKGIFGSTDDEDEEKIKQALELTGMSELAKQEITTLSGGEMQRTFLAQLFAQSPSIFLLDEPTNHLDLIYQKEIFFLIDEWRQQKNTAVVSVVHDLSLAKLYGTRALLLDKGHCIAYGDIKTVMNKENLSRAYSMDVYEWMNRLNSAWQDGK